MHTPDWFILRAHTIDSWGYVRFYVDNPTTTLSLNQFILTRNINEAFMFTARHLDNQTRYSALKLTDALQRKLTGPSVERLPAKELRIIQLLNNEDY